MAELHIPDGCHRTFDIYRHPYCISNTFVLMNVETVMTCKMFNSINIQQLAINAPNLYQTLSDKSEMHHGRHCTFFVPI